MRPNFAPRISASTSSNLPALPVELGGEDGPGHSAEDPTAAALP
jgi:hypothetical protein